jgi:Mrp family chromosome partitioning ATPase/capsular polysaccharide biosynthesis protein
VADRSGVELANFFGLWRQGPSLMVNTSESQQTTLVDLLRPLRRRGWIVLLVIAIAVGSAIGMSLAQTKKYSAAGTFQFSDESHDFGLVGVQVAPTLTPAQLANTAAQTIDQPQVVTHVKRALHSSSSIPQLASSVSASVDPNANLVHVQATSNSATGAASLANAFTTAAVAVANDTQRAGYRASAKDLARHAPPKSDFAATSVYQEELGRLRALATIASPASVTSRAQVPSGPSSPRTARNAAIAAFLGLLVGLVLVYVLESIDRRLRSARDVEEGWGYPLLGRVREDALGHSPNNRDAARLAHAIDWEQFRILRRNLEFVTADEGHRVVAVTSAMPQEGKTTVACFVAFASAAAGKRTLLVECDLRRPVLAERLSLEPHPGLSDFVASRANPADVLQVVRFTDPVSAAVPTNGSGPHGDSTLFHHEVTCITAGSVTQHPVEILDSSAFNVMLDEVRRVYDLVILDTAPLLPVVDALEVIGKSDVVIVCGRATKLTRGQARAGKEALDRVPQSKIGLVVTGMRPTRDEYGAGYDGYYEYAGR